jgi:hypothetical protein
VEDHVDFILGPVSQKEYKDTVAELNGSRTNRVFEFFKITAPECVGFAKHREAGEREADALTTTDADAGETATSPHGAPTKKTTRKVAPAAAATTAAEGKARKKRGTRPTDSPPTAKRTRVVVKDRNREPEGEGSEWEPIKILFKNSTYEPDFTRAPLQASLARST